MKARIHIAVFLLMVATAPLGLAEPSDEQPEVQIDSRLLTLKIDKVEVGSRSMEAQLGELNQQLGKINHSLQQVAEGSLRLEPEVKQALLQASNDVSLAAQALKTTAESVPEVTGRLLDELPRTIEQAEQPIANLSSMVKDLSYLTVRLAETYPRNLAATDSKIQALAKTVSGWLIVVVIATALILLGVFAAGVVYARKKLFDPINQNVENLTQVLQSLSKGSAPTPPVEIPAGS